MKLRDYQEEAMPDIRAAVQRVVSQISSEACHINRVRSAVASRSPEDIFRERVTRRADVPIHEVELVYHGSRYSVLVAPVCPGAESGTLRVRAFLKNQYSRGSDVGRHTVPLAVPSNVEPGSIEDVWSKLSAHQRLSMFAAVKDRTPKGGPREVVQ